MRRRREWKRGSDLVCWYAGFGFLQLGVLGLGFLQDRNVRVGVFPQREEMLVGAALTAYCMSSSRWQQAEEIEEARRKCSEQLPWAAELRRNFCVERHNLASSPVFSLAFHWEKR